MGRHFLVSLELLNETAPKAGVRFVLELPKKYRVILLNDDYTPMDFVIKLLLRFFSLSEEVAVRVMLEVHTLGRGVGGIYTRDIAETKVAQVNHYARAHGHPLLCKMEPD